jgi:hypothetical protein
MNPLRIPATGLGEYDYLGDTITLLNVCINNLQQEPAPEPAPEPVQETLI